MLANPSCLNKFPKGLVPGTVAYIYMYIYISVYINDLSELIKWTLIKFTNDTKLGRRVDLFDGRKALWRSWIGLIDAWNLITRHSARLGTGCCTWVNNNKPMRWYWLGERVAGRSISRKEPSGAGQPSEHESECAQLACNRNYVASRSGKVTVPS